MNRLCFLLASLLCFMVAWAQPFQWPAEYVPTVTPGGTLYDGALNVPHVMPLNPVVSASADWLELYAAPSLVYRDWLGSRTFRQEDGSFNLFFAKAVDELVFEQDFIVTLREGWRWSDGVEITADDAIAAHMLRGHPEMQSDWFICSVVDDAPVVYEKLGRYQYRITLPRPRVNALAVKDCGFIPAHIFMPVFESEGAEGVRHMWDESTDPSEIVSGGPYVISEVRPGDRVVLERNPLYGTFVQAADGSPLPGPDRWVFWLVQDVQAAVAMALTGELSTFRPVTLDQLRAVREGIERGQLTGTLHANLGPSLVMNLITYNFNHSNACKREMFRSVAFRQAIAIMIDRDALIETAFGGLGFPAKLWMSEAARPFHAPHIEPFVFDPDRGLELLASIGFSELSADGVLRNPDSGCRVEFELLVNTGVPLRAMMALVMAQTLEAYGVRVLPREVSTEIWANAITGEGLPRRYDSDAVMWGLAGGDIDNPSGLTVFTLGANLNAWNKSTTDVEPWEVLLDLLSKRMDETLELESRIEIFNERAEVLREYLPMTPLVSPAFHIYLDVGNPWPTDAMDAVSLQFNPGNYRQNLMAPRLED